MKIVAVTQARIGSSRLPNKILKKVEEQSLLSIHLERIKKAKTINKIIVATTNEPGVESIVDIANQSKVSYFKGSTNDVLDRFYQAVKSERPNYIVRLTSDCPLIDPQLIDKVVKSALDKGVDYTSNAIKPTFPDGVDTEVIKFSALEKAWYDATLKSDREHVTAYIWKNSTIFDKDIFTGYSYENESDYSNFRITVDEERDFEVIKILIKELGTDKSWSEYIEYIEKNSYISDINSSLSRNEGYNKSLLEDK